ncbi:MAG: DUF4878 domain-containing protein [Oscillospiraceae bacterium]|nr:DUF4878 domain-containing protein [Oscillospiraceae bacterium]
MRKIAVTLLAVTMVFAIVACGGGESPENTVASFEKAIKNADVNALIECFEPEYSSMLKQFLSMLGDDLFTVEEMVSEIFNMEVNKSDLAKAKLTIIDKEVNGDQCVANIEFALGGQTSRETVPMVKIEGKWYFMIDLD